MTQKEFNDVCEMVKPKDIEHLEYLHMRWNDEKEYEDWKDYEKSIRKRFSYLDVVKVSKRPFGFSFKVNTNVIRVSVTSRNIDIILVS